MDSALTRDKLKIVNINHSSPWRAADCMGVTKMSDSVYICGGFSPNRSNEVWKTGNFKEWRFINRAQWEARSSHALICFKNNLLVLGGTIDGKNHLNDIHQSSDGSSWRPLLKNAPWEPRMAFGCLVHNGLLYVFGGVGESKHFNDVWVSEDGKRWKCVKEHADWGPRGMFGSVIFNNKIWLIGGGTYDSSYVFNCKENYNDSWSSSDGIEWEQVNPNCAFSPRRFHSAAVFNDYMVIAFGFELDPALFGDNLRNGVKLNSLNRIYYSRKKGRKFGNLNDVWFSKNGNQWDRVQVDIEPRHGSHMIDFANKLYFFGGFGQDFYNDVYSLSISNEKHYEL